VLSQRAKKTTNTQYCWYSARTNAIAVLQLILHAANLPCMAPKGMCFLNATKSSCLSFPVVNIVEKFYPSASPQTFMCSFVFLLKSSILKKMFHHGPPIVTTLSWQCFRLQYSTSFLATNSWLCSGMQLHSQEMSYDHTKAIMVEYFPLWTSTFSVSCASDR